MAIPTNDPVPETIVIGVLGEFNASPCRATAEPISALQGAFIEHIHYLQRYVTIF